MVRAVVVLEAPCGPFILPHSPTDSNSYRPHLAINRPALRHAPVSVQPNHRIGQLVTADSAPVIGLPVPVLDTADYLSIAGIADTPEIAGGCRSVSRNAGPLERHQVIHHGGAQDGVAAVSLATPEHHAAYLAGVSVPVQDGEAQALPVGCAAVVGHAAPRVVVPPADIRLFHAACPAGVEPSPCMRMLACELFTRIAYIFSCASYAHCVYMTYEQRAVAQQETDR